VEHSQEEMTVISICKNIIGKNTKYLSVCTIQPGLVGVFHKFHNTLTDPKLSEME
jgi:hypothetical protein